MPVDLIDLNGPVLLDRCINKVLPICNGHTEDIKGFPVSDIRKALIDYTACKQEDDLYQPFILVFNTALAHLKRLKINDARLGSCDEHEYFVSKYQASKPKFLKINKDGNELEETELPEVPVAEQATLAEQALHKSACKTTQESTQMASRKCMLEADSESHVHIMFLLATTFGFGIMTTKASSVWQVIEFGGLGSKHSLSMLSKKVLGLENPEKGSQRLVLLIFKKLSPIKELQGDKLVDAWWQCVLCHYTLWREGIHHHDTGTMPFMAIDLLQKDGQDGKVKHQYHHDIESFIYIFIWISLQYKDSKLGCKGIACKTNRELRDI
ncbi:hypothetical protein F5J12DRAFT_787089 [Pisolithus orientalis]|uniref:uncharacterized protein n=1 Tax=Pisolithus orientalis TaxID=936130 RepID=UPI00222414F9|nr:uncharacterized protein F5J12DRAFT_787089 [Pisolithus orientalis]KAI5987340.1 hypothetical protein F5J12DRAFT_787089 [Pisolithus orientalis]